jgi:hypothetical protein
VKRFTLHQNARGADCARLAEWNRGLDCLDRFERTIEPSSLGTPEIPDIHVVDHLGQRIFSGAYATDVVCRNMPPLARRKPGCDGESCAR